MSFDFYLDPAEVRERAHEQIRKLEMDNELLSRAIYNLSGFIYDESLTSLALEALKQKMNDIRLAKTVKSAANDSLIADYQLLVEYVRYEKEEILNGEEIRLGIETAKGIVSRLRTARRSLREICLISGLESVRILDINESIGDIDRQIDYQQLIIAVLENKRDTYWEIEKITSRLFNNDKQLRSLIRPGIWGIVNAASGLPHSYNSFILSNWRRNILSKGSNVFKATELANRTLNALRVLRGCPSGVAMIGDPVNASTGNFIYPTIDLTINGRFPLVLKRFYNSRSDYVGSLGKGWTHNYEIHLVEHLSGNKELLVSIQFGEDGHQEQFKLNEDGGYTTPKGKFSKLMKTKAGNHILTYPDKSFHLFNGLGLVQLTRDKHGHETIFEYQSEPNEGLLSKVSTPSGHLIFSYTKNNQLASVSDNSGRAIKYKYSEKSNSLISFTNLNGYEAIYEDDAENRLTKITNERDHDILKNTFDDYDRIIKQVFPDGSVMEYIYEKQADGTMEFIERNKTKTLYKQDDYYRTIEIIHPDKAKEQFRYNENSQRKAHHNQKTQKALASYDDRGNMLTFVNALGIKTEFEYTERNQVTKVKVDGKVKLTKTYDQEGNLLEVNNALNYKTALEYMKNGIPQTIIKPDGSKISLTYDERKNVTKIDMAGVVTQYKYDDLNRPIVSIDGNGNETNYQYDDANNIVAVKNAEGNTQKYEYNECNKVTSTTDFAGGVFKREYNELNKPAKLIDQLGRVTKLEYDLMWNLARVTQPNGAIINYEYNDFNQLKAKHLPDGGKVEYYYDTRGNKIGVVDELGNRTGFTYDDLSQLIAIRSKSVNVTCNYNAEGQITSIKDGENSINLTYDEIGKLTSEQNAMGDTRRYTYTSLGKVEMIIDEAGRITRYDYELGGRLKSITYPDGTKNACTYDLNGNIKTITQKTGEELKYEYDSLNRVISIKSNLGGTKKCTYDALSNVTSTTDELGNTIHYEYTPTGNLSKVVDALGNIALYTYDEMDQMIEIRQLGKDHISLDTDLQNVIQLNEENEIHVTRYERNKMGQLISITDTCGYKENFKYDLKGQLIQKIDKEGYLTKYAYTSIGDIKHIQYADGKEVKMKYNSLRQLIEIEDCLGVTKISLDKLGRATHVTDHNNKKVSYDWGILGEKRKITYPDGTVINYDYDELMRLKEVDDGTNKTNYFYDKQSRLIEKLFQNGFKTTYAYNSIGKIAEISHMNNGELLDKLEYDYDLAGNKTVTKKYRCDLLEDTGEFSYSYDPLNRLQNVVKDGENLRNYKYDEYGNRTKKVEQGNVTNYTYNALNQLTSTIDTTNDSKRFIYDKRGNVVTEYKNETLVNQYEFSSLNRLEKAINHETNQQTTYRYNGLGHRVGRTSRTIGISKPPPIKYIDDVLDITKPYHNLLERGGVNYIWDTNLLSAIYDDVTQDYLLDSAGSPIRVSQDVVAYDEFGNLLTESKNNQPFGFTGYQFDNATNKWHAHAREYDGVTGRFISEDVVKGLSHQPLTQNLYVYCFNKPLNFVDLDGNWGYDEHYEITNLAAQLLGFSDGGDFVKTFHRNNKSIDELLLWPWRITHFYQHHLEHQVCILIIVGFGNKIRG